MNFKMPTIQTAAKSYFNAKKLNQAVEKAEMKALTRQAFVLRKTAMDSIQKSRSISNPGDPPKSHSGLLRRFMLYSVDYVKRVAVIGPKKINKPSIVPSALEHGGSTMVYAGKNKPRMKRQIRPRPFMGPALTKSAPQLSREWRDIVRA